MEKIETGELIQEARRLVLERETVGKTPSTKLTADMQIEKMECIELIDKRTENSKLFGIGGGIYQAIYHMSPIHFMDTATGEWEEIDNTFEEAKTLFGNTILKNRHNGKMKLSLSMSGTPEMVQIEDEKGNSIAWTLEGAQRKQPMYEEKQNNPHHASLAMQKRRVDEMISDEVVYKDILPGTNMHCRVDGTSFKDEVVFNDLEAAKSISFLIETIGLSLSIQSDTSILVLDRKGEMSFFMPVPFMTDKEGEIGAVDAILTQVGQKQWRLTYILDTGWLRNASFPVCLDPELKIASGTQNLVTVDSMQPATRKFGSPTTIKCSSSQKTLLYMQPTTFSELFDASYVITKAYARFDLGSIKEWEALPAVHAREVLTSWAFSTLSYANQPQISEVDVCAKAPEESEYALSLDISDLARKWQNEPCYGVVMDVREDNKQIDIKGKFHIAVNYVSQAGMENYFTTESHSVGRAGTAHVNLLNGNLLLEHIDTVCTGKRLPISISHYYNTCYRNIDETNVGAGLGWRHSLVQTFKTVQRTEDGKSIKDYLFTDGDGTVHSFNRPAGQTTGPLADQSGLSLSATNEASPNPKITDKMGNAVYTFLQAANGFATFENAQGDRTSFTSTNKLIGGTTINVTSIKDGAGRITNINRKAEAGVVYRLDSIEAPGVAEGKGVRFGYNSAKQLVEIAHEDGAITKYEYDAKNLLTKVINFDGHALSIDYYDTAPYRVKRITESSGNLVGNSREYQYGDLMTVVTDKTVEGGKELYYHFNDSGNLISIRDLLGNASVVNYSKDKPVNHADSMSKLQRATINLLRNHSFEKNSNWDFEGTVTYAATGQKLGSRCLYFTNHYYSGVQSASQKVQLTPGKTYTLSFYGRRCGKIEIRPTIVYFDTNGERTQDEGVPLLSTAGDEYERASYTFTIPSDACSGDATVKLTAVSGQEEVSRAWIDCIQLEESTVPGKYSLLTNGDFIHSKDGKAEEWIAKEDNDETDCVIVTDDGKKPDTLSENALYLKGNFLKKKGIYQELGISGNAGDTFVAGGWAQALCRPHGKLHNIPQSYIDEKRKTDFDFRYRWEKLTNDPEYKLAKDFGLRVAFKVRTGEFVSGGNIDFNDEWCGWRFTCGPAVAPDRYTAVRFYVDYEENINWAKFGGLFLYKEEFGVSYDYDSENNIVSIEELTGLKSKAEYDIYNNLVGYRDSGKPEWQKYHLEYDPRGNHDPLTAPNNVEGKKHLLYRSVSPDGIIKKHTYDAKGNRTSTHTASNDGEFTGFMMQKTEYSSDQNYPVKSINTRGKNVLRSVNLITGLLNNITDAAGQKVEYSYDLLKRILETKAVVDGKTHRNEYEYMGDRLVQARHNTGYDDSCDVLYNFEFDALGNPTKTKVGNQTLSELTYSDTGDKLVKRMDYGNGGQVHYVYDEFKRLIAKRYDNEEAPRYTYEYGQDGKAQKMHDHYLGRMTLSDYDFSGRSARTKEYEGERVHYATEVLMDETNRASVLRQRIKESDLPFETQFSYDTMDRVDKVTFGAEDAGVRYRYDALGRLSSRSIEGEDAAEYRTQYHYLLGGHGTGSTTLLVEKIEQPGHSFVYTYDDTGSITKETHNEVATEYCYDKVGQLVRVNDANQNKSVTYIYDRGGNILSKSEHAYATGNGTTGLSTPTHTATFTYGDSNWRDKLTAYDGIPITYDAIGNPLDDGIWTYTWKMGRMLTRMRSAGQEIHFVYNAAGLRVKKESSTRGVTEYILSGKQVLHLIRTPATEEADHEIKHLHFWYDAQGRVASVTYQGAQYWYVHNHQGDVVAIIDKDYSEVVVYSYDVWGKQLSCAGSMAGTLGRENPFRYREYVYDEETGLYYLRSRYYAPELGRFVSADSLVTRNMFAYCINSPKNMKDDEGSAPMTSSPNMPRAIPIVPKPATVTVTTGNKTVTITNSPGINMEKIVELISTPDIAYGDPLKKGQSDCQDTVRWGVTIPLKNGSNKMYYEEPAVVKKGTLASLNGGVQALNPGDLVFAECNADTCTNDKCNAGIMNGNRHMGHVGLVIEVDWNDGTGPRNAVFQSVALSVHSWSHYHPDLDALWPDDIGGPNITDFTTNWTNYATLR